MYLNLKGLLSLAALALAVGATWWIARSPNLTGGQENGPQRSVPPGYYLRNAKVIGMGEDGRILYEIYARQAEQYPLEERMQLEEVEVSYRDETEIPWRLTGDRGTAPLDQSFLELTGNVRLRSLAATEDKATEITTDTIRLDTIRRIATTDGRVSLRFGDQQVNATGMIAYLDEDRLELTSNVNGKFSPR